MSYQFYKEIKKLDKHPAYRFSVPYSAWRERTMELLQSVFTPMYRRVFEPNWNNSMFSNMKKPYVYYDFEQGIYEVYLPTNIDGAGRLHYWRIIVKCYDMIDRESLESRQIDLQTPYTRPMGVIDRETICHLAKTNTPEYKKTLREAWQEGGRRAWFKKLLRGFRHEKRKGYFTIIVVQESPEIAVKRMLSLIYKFCKQGLKGFLNKLKLPNWMFEEYLSKRANASLLILVKKFSVTIRQIFKGLLETFDYLTVKMRDLYAEIGRQTVQKSKIRPLVQEIREFVHVFRRENSLRDSRMPEPPIIKELVCVLRAIR